jgi:hypothetical protein
MRRFAPVVITCLIPAVLAAQAPVVQPPGDGVMFAFERFADLFGDRLVAAFDSIPAARYDYRPTPVQQSIGYIAQHLEGANYALCERFSDAKHSRTAKDSLAEHYSQLSTYMRLLGMVPPSALPPIKRTAIALPASALSPYVGVYRVAPGLDLHVTMQNGELFIRSTGGATVRLWPGSSGDFFVNEVNAQLTFTRDASGTVTGLVWHQFGRDRPAPKVPPQTRP